MNRLLQHFSKRDLARLVSAQTLHTCDFAFSSPSLDQSLQSSFAKMTGPTPDWTHSAMNRLLQHFSKGDLARSVSAQVVTGLVPHWSISDKCLRNCFEIVT